MIDNASDLETNQLPTTNQPTKPKRRHEMNEQPNGNPGTVYHTPQEIIDFLAPCPSIGKLPPGADGSEPESPADESHSLKIAGVPARYVKCPGKYIAVAVDERHDYQLSVHRLTPGNVVVEFSIDGESQCRMTCRNFEVGRRCGIAAARAYAKYKAHLAQSHKARKERIRAEKAAATEAQP